MASNGGKVSLLLGMVVMGLSPSFIDWQESDKKGQILAYYGAAIALIALGLWDGK